MIRSDTSHGVHMRPESTLELDKRFTHLVESKDSFVLVGDEDSAVLEGELTAELLPLLNGRLTASDIAEALHHLYPREAVHLALLELRGTGVVSESRSTSVNLKLSDGARRLMSAWESRGGGSYALTPRSSDGHRFILTEDYLDPSLIGLSQAREAGTLVRLGRRDIWVGPTVGPASDSCIHCLQDRLRLNLKGRALLREAETEPDSELRVAVLRGEPDPRWFEVLASWSGDVSGRIIAIDPSDEVVAFEHIVHRLPQCAECGDPTLQIIGANFRLTERATVPGSESGLRVCTPEVTLQRLDSLISPLTGVVRYVRPVETAASDVVHVYTASHARSFGPANAAAIKDEARDHAGGKGMSRIDAQVSAIGESLERFSAVYRGTEPTVRAKRSDLDAPSFAPNELMLFSESQYADRVAWNAGLAGGFQWVPSPYIDEEIDWSQVRSLSSGERRFVPTSHVFLAYDGIGRPYCRGDSNGLAGGNCLEEALLQGLLELVERDSVAMWWYSRGRVPTVDQQCVREAHEPVVACHERLGRDIWVLDLTTDLRIPCFAAVSAQGASDRQDIIFGFGCHPDPGIALRRALSEVNQMLPTVLKHPVERERQLLPDFRDAIEWWNDARIENHPYLAPGGPQSTTLATGPQLRGGLTDTLDRCVARIQTAGVDIYAADLTRPEVPFSVAKVVAPGLRHFWRRLGPGRLYEIPETLGWVDEPFTEDDTNPIPLFV